MIHGFIAGQQVNSIRSMVLTCGGNATKSNEKWYIRLGRMNRKRTPQEIETAVLMKCARRCALCFGLFHDLSEKHGQVAHVDQDPSNYTEDNLAFLCVMHHSLYDSKTSQHKNYTAHEVKVMRTALHDAISRKEHASTNAVTPPAADASEAEETLFVRQRRSLPDTDLASKENLERAILENSDSPGLLHGSPVSKPRTLQKVHAVPLCRVPLQCFVPHHPAR